MVSEGRLPSFHAAQWRGGKPSNYSKIIFSFLWRLTSLLLQLLPVGNQQNIQRASSLIIQASFTLMAWPMRAGIYRFMPLNGGGGNPLIIVKISLIPLATDLPPFAAVASKEPT
jgi:hypothetical protein